MATVCSSCGTTNADEAQFCASCGSTLAAPSCAACGTALPPESEFCASCGAPVSSEPAEPAPATPAAEAAAAPLPDAPPEQAAALPPDAPPPAPAAATPPPPLSPAQAFAPPPPPPPPPPPAPPVAAGTPPNRRKMWLIVAIAVLVVAAVAVAAYFLFIRDSGDKTVAKPTPTPTLVSSPGATTTATAGPSPSASPSGTPVLAFVSGRKSDGISLANTDGTVAQLVPSTGSAITSPEWSPGGRYLAYIQGPYETAQLYVYDATTQRSAPFSFGGSPPAAVESFAWTGPAQLVAAGFTQRPRRFTENAVLWSCNVFLGTATTLKDSSGAVVTGRDISAAAGKLVFDVYTDRYREGPYSVQVTANLRLLDLQSGMVQTIASHSELEGYEFDYQEPLLSPDGSAVMFSSTGTDVSVTYEILGTDGSVIMAPKHLLFPSRYSWNPARPTQIAFAGRRQENGPTFIFRYDTASGGGPKVIANISGQILMDIAWSPDGKTVAYTLLDHQYNLDTGDLMAFSPGQLESARLAAPALYVTWGVSSYAAGGGTGTSPPPPLAPSPSPTP